MLATLQPQYVADIIMLASQIQLGCYMCYWLLLRMLGLIITAAETIHLDLLE